MELRARGMPLGLMPEMTYEETETTLQPGDQVIFYSDGLVEAHNRHGEMFGFPRLRELLAGAGCASDLIACLVNALADFTGADWEQEDDVTFLSLACVDEAGREHPGAVERVDGEYRLLAEFSIASQPGNERQAMEQVGELALSCGLSSARVERLKTAVAEATMNAMEHGNHYRPDLPVAIFVLASPRGLLVRIRDHGGTGVMGGETHEEPDLDAKLAGLQSPRGWGMFLIRNMVDEVRVSSDEQHHTLELFQALEGEDQ
jgi:anti-sigma regulatory factor (Ser/Thr protein kinase)